VRIVPPLPWEFDFDGLSDPPVTWVGARYRHVVREVDGNPVMVKVTTIPKGARSRSWMGPSDLHDYTIQADVRASEPAAAKSPADGDDDLPDQVQAGDKGPMPDMGVIAQGYTLDLMGNAQQLQVRSWDSMRRMARETPVSWDRGVWYTLKLQAAVDDGKAVLRGKVWPRDEEEPDQWQLEATDETPVRQGSPGLYGDARNAEIFIDNVRVYPNP
jgi:hypothetical protein